MDNKELIRKAMSEVGKISHKKSPRTREHFQMMGKKSAEARRNKALLQKDTDLSTDEA